MDPVQYANHMSHLQALQHGVPIGLRWFVEAQLRSLQLYNRGSEFYIYLNFSVKDTEGDLSMQSVHSFALHVLLKAHFPNAAKHPKISLISLEYLSFYCLNISLDSD